MEKWKFGVIAVLILGLGGANVLQNWQRPPTPTPEKTPTPEPDPFVGRKALTSGMPEWKNITNWTNLGGKPAPTLTSLRGQPALVKVFRTGCWHCSDATPFMEKLYERYAPRGLKVVAIQSPGDTKDPFNTENNWANVQKWLKEHGVKYPVGMDTQSAWFQGKLGGQLYPTVLIFGRDGVVKFAHTGYDATEIIAVTMEIENLLPGRQPREKRAQELAKWLSEFVPTSPDPDFQQEFRSAIAQRLKPT